MKARSKGLRWSVCGNPRNEKSLFQSGLWVSGGWREASRGLEGGGNRGAEGSERVNRPGQDTAGPNTQVTNLI